MFRHAFLTVLFAASLCRQASALIIFINPGPVGQINTDFQLDVPELVDLQVDGEEFTLDFVFSDMKHLEVDVLNQYAITLSLEMNTTDLEELTAPLEDAYFLPDEESEPILLGTFPSEGSGSNPAIVDYSLATDPSSAPVSFVHNGVHLEGHYPRSQISSTGVTIVSAHLRFQTSIGIEPFGTLEVGERGPPVPEPTTLTLATLGLLGMSYRRRKRA